METPIGISGKSGIYKLMLKIIWARAELPYLVGAGSQGCAAIFHGKVGNESDEDESQGLSHQWMTIFFICRKEQSYEILLPPQTTFGFEIL